MALIEIPGPTANATRRSWARTAAIAATAGAAVLFIAAGVPAGHRMNAEGVAEKTSLLQWAAAGGETAFRFTTLSAKTGGEMFFDPEFTFEHAGKEYASAGAVTSEQMVDLGEHFVIEVNAPSSPPGYEKPYLVHSLKAESMPAEKRAAFDKALQLAATPDEKTSLLMWAAAGGETAFRFTTLSAKTGAEMFFSPDFTFQKAGQEYASAGAVTSSQMGELGENFVLDTAAPSPPPGVDRKYFVHP